MASTVQYTFSGWRQLLDFRHLQLDYVPIQNVIRTSVIHKPVPRNPLMTATGGFNNITQTTAVTVQQLLLTTVSYEAARGELLIKLMVLG